MKDRFTHAELKACIKREIAKREAVYPRLVAKGTMKPEEADNQIAMMQTVLLVLDTTARVLTLFRDLTGDQRKALAEGGFWHLGNALEWLSHAMPEEAQEALF